MAWKIEFEAAAERELGKLDAQAARRILKFLRDRLAKLDNPRLLVGALRRPKPDQFWKYRVGDYRVIARIEDSRLVILVVRIGNRRDVYRSSRGES